MISGSKTETTNSKQPYKAKYNTKTCKRALFLALCLM